ncbi:MAG TPA: hypothetical protein VJS63_05575 [Bradyrhizobium sp.]|nr:hypothetical protein [Bradyrhizobium sp.]
MADDLGKLGRFFLLAGRRHDGIAASLIAGLDVERSSAASPSATVAVDRGVIGIRIKIDVLQSDMVLTGLERPAPSRLLPQFEKTIRLP